VKEEEYICKILGFYSGAIDVYFFWRGGGYGAVSLDDWCHVYTCVHICVHVFFLLKNFVNSIPNTVKCKMVVIMFEIMV